MISLRISEQELFDLIMAVYAAANTFKHTERESDACERRQRLLEKLHAAFDAELAGAAR